MQNTTIDFFSRNPESLNLVISWDIDVLRFKVRAGEKSKKNNQFLCSINEALNALRDCINFEMIYGTHKRITYLTAIRKVN